VTVGLVAGVSAAAGLTRVLSSLMYGVTPTDPATFTVVVALLALTAAVACVIPARRAATVDPVVTLRAE
jgi:ABC-type lipoprotein release transport system permease subunit